jgi:rod shape determining protein RodA
MTAIPAALVLTQPDLGTTIMLLATAATLFFLAGLSWWYFVGLSVLLLTALPVLWHQMHAYQRQRVLTFLDPERDPLGSGYHIIQSKIALGSGGI